MSTSKNQGSSSSFGLTDSSSFIAPFQVPFLQSLGGSAAGLAQQQLGPIQQQAQGLGRDLQRSGGAFLGGLQDIAGGNVGAGVNQAVGGLLNLGNSDIAQQLTQRLLGSAQPGQGTLQAIAGGGGPLASSALQLGGPLQGTDILSQLTQGLGDQLLQPNPALAGSVSALDQAIQNNLQSTVGTIAGQASLGGNTGGSRQALASGLAGQEAQRQFGQGAASLISQDFATRQALAPALQQAQIGAAGQLQSADLAQRGLQLSGAELLDRSALASRQQQLQAAGQLQQGSQFGTAGLSELLGTLSGGLSAGGGLGLGGGQLQAAAGASGLDQLGGLFNLGLAPFSAAFSPLLSASQVVGDPTVLNQLRSRQGSESDRFGFGVSI